ncbi:coiled-coil domain-containing protein 146 isoform X1 [Strigops habroptila]|uniref:coiled-coil domain-containing protein 146 isoform X1 n=1 Tax=Strigops habroptila TaxID=2489341 RepID=UPI0011CFBB52|nr:coiled-coil domain-containing protein 146 isoform X1 [Strigops habroptila]XP_030336794.1 coiled-coil domain-containing protein 146 isoform X1 [Strigops habroptila]XP_030336795.1 coiled-coil domain-containing protein 146 isoform X1 [Strigops habroptila]XP_030336796.1 coiled-coil domain-containing protein 146 isoform X1 [Strigops habroptila]
MSEAGEESSSSSDTESAIEEQSICGIVPTVYSQDEGSTDVTASPAFQCLDELFSAGKITCTRVAELKGKYTVLHKTVISLQESEIQLLQEAKRLSAELEQQQHELEKAEQFPEESFSEVLQIRKQLLSCQNEYNAIKERESDIEYKIKCLQEEKSLLENEYARIPKHRGTEKKIKQLKENCEELCKEVNQKKAEINAIKEDVSSKKKLMLIDKKETEKLLEKQANLKDELVRILGVPVKLGKEAEKINCKKNDEEKKKKALNDQIEELNGTLKAIERRTEEILQEKEDIMKELDGKQILLESKERECSTLSKLLEINREKELVVVAEREALEENLNKCALEKKEQSDILVHKQTQKDRELKVLKKMELQLNTIFDALERDKSQHKRLKLEAEAIPKSSGLLLERRQELQKEVEVIKRSLTEQETISGMDARVLQECMAEEGLLYKELEKSRKELSRLAHLIWLKVEEREQKSRDVQKVQIQLQNVIKEKKRKDLEIREFEKRRRKIQKELQGLAKIYEVVHNERNKCIDLVHAAHQKANEIRKRVKLVENEVENLRNILITEERKLQKQQLKNTNNIAIIDSLKSDWLKIVQAMQEMKEKKEQQYLVLEKLTNTVTQTEEEIVQLHKKYERALQQRNESGLLLRDREEELCILYEKIHMQEMLCRNGDIEIQVTDEKIKFLKLKVDEKKREIESLLKMLPVKKALDSQLVMLQIQHSQCKDRIKEMEEIFADPTNESRKRDLGGKDPSPPELLKKIEQLEIELVQKEEKLLETDLLYEHLSRLLSRAHAAAADGKQDTLLIAKRTTDMKKMIKVRTQKMMALVAELSMQQALAIKLQQEVRDKEQLLMIVSSRIDQGLPPPEEIENECLKILRNEKMQKEAAEARAKRAAEEEQAAAPGYMRTTAEPRPTAYIPNDEHSLPLPRPYGALAPFKPTEPGANMRHFRKPVVKPIEV